MTKLEQIATFVAELDEVELRHFADWFGHFQAELWDKQIDEDTKAGRLDRFIADAKAEIAAGNIHRL